MDHVFRRTRAIVLVVSCVGSLSGESFQIFSRSVFFFFLLRPHRDSSGVYEPEGDAAKNEPPASVLFGIHRIDDRSLGCAVVNPARAPTKHSKGLEFWRTLRAGVGRLARSDGDPHYRHGKMKESSPDVSILLRMSNTGSTAVRPNIDVASAPDGPKKNLKHRTKGDEGPVVGCIINSCLGTQTHPPAPAAATPISVPRTGAGSVRAHISHAASDSTTWPGVIRRPLSCRPCYHSRIRAKKFRTP